MKRSMILPFAILAAVPFIMVLGNSMLIPVFPRMEAEMDLSQFQVGLLVTAFSVPAGLVIPFSGALSDYLGRKAIIAPALILYGLGGLVAGTASLLLAEPFGVIIAGRIIQGIGAGGTYQIALALTGDLFTSSERTKALGLLEAANGLGKMVSPILGSLFALITWYTPFFVYGILAIPLALAVWWIVKEPERKEGRRPIRQYTQALARIFREKAGGLLACYLAGAAGLFLLFGLLSYLSDVLEATYDIRDFAKGFVLAIPVTTMAVTSYATGALLQKRTPLLKPVVITGLLLTGASFLLLTFLGGLAWMLILVSVIGLGIGATLPPLNTLITGATDTSERGLVTSLYGTVRFFAVALGPPVFGLVMELGRMPMFAGAAAIAAIAAAAAFFLVHAQRMLQGGTDQGKTQSESSGENGTLPANSGGQPQHADARPAPRGESTPVEEREPQPLLPR